jgi:hypothetical protein
MKHPILVRLAVLGFSTSILLLALTAASTMVFGTPQAIKSALRDSGAYRSASEQLAKKAGDMATSSESDSKSESDLQLDREAVSQAAASSFTDKAIQTNAEQAIDATYSWLDGKTAKPEIKLDLQPYINSFTQSLGDRAVQRTQSLPLCTPEQLRQIDPNNIDVFNLPCLPPGVNLNAAKDQAIAKAVESNDFLKEPVISVDSLPKDTAGKTAVDRAENVPTLYQWSMRAPLILAVLALLSTAVIMLLLRPDWRLVIQKLARPLFGTGIALVILVVVARLFFSYVSKPEGLASKLAGGDFKDVILTFMSSLQQAYTDKLLNFGIAYLIVGLVALVALRIVKQHGGSATAASPVAAASSTSSSSSTSDNSTSSDDGKHRPDVDSPTSDSGSNDSGSSSDGGGSSSD